MAEGKGAAADAFEVVVTAFAAAEDPPELRLQRVFGIEAALATRLLARLPATVQRNVPRVRAEYFRKALIKIGAGVEVRDASGTPVEPLPEPEPEPTPERGERRASSETPAPKRSVLSRATDDTLIDARAHPSADEPDANADRAVADNGYAWADAPLPSHEDDIALPAHPTLREGAPTQLVLGAPPSAPRAAATMVSSAAVGPHVAASRVEPTPQAQPPAELPLARANPQPSARAPALGYESFRPPGLELDSALPSAGSRTAPASGLDLMSRLPSSIWDAPPSPRAAGRAGAQPERAGALPQSTSTPPPAGKKTTPQAHVITR
jgi:hypothetical protein